MYFLQGRVHSIATTYNKANINKCTLIFNAFNEQQAHVIDVATTAYEHQHIMHIMHKLDIFLIFLYDKTKIYDTDYKVMSN